MVAQRRVTPRAACARTWRRGAAVALLCLLAGCTSLSVAPRPSGGPQAPPSPASPADERPENTEPRAGEAAPAPRPRNDSSSASRSLLTQSRAERAAGSFSQAAASIERALRIDPNNAELWLELGEIHLETGDARQAEAMARKALTLVGSNGRLEAQAERLLRAAASR